MKSWFVDPEDAGCIKGGNYDGINSQDCTDNRDDINRGNSNHHGCAGCCSLDQVESHTTDEVGKGGDGEHSQWLRELRDFAAKLGPSIRQDDVKVPPAFLSAALNTVHC